MAFNSNDEVFLGEIVRFFKAGQIKSGHLAHLATRSMPYCWFSHDVTKTQTKKLSILPRFYLDDALEQLKTNFHTNVRFKRVLGFVIEYT